MLKRKKYFTHPKVYEQRVQGGLPFYYMDTAIYRNVLNMEKIKAEAGELCERIIFPCDIKGFENMPKLDTENYEKLLLFNTALYIIKNCNLKNRKLSLCIADKDGILAPKMRLLVKEISTIGVMTQRKDLYENEINLAMEEFGARVRFMENQNSDIVIDLDNEGLKGKAVFSKSAIGGENLSLPICYSSLLVPHTDPVEFASALCEFSHVSALESLRYRNLTLYKKTCNLSDLCAYLQGVLY